MPPIPGPASEFYKALLQLRGQKGPLYSQSERFEGIIGGEITIKRLGEPKGTTMITYSFKSNGEKREIDIIHAASGVKELAVLHLIIREFARSGDFLIIEEPESHLHPSAQIKLMEIMSILIKKGVRVLITTHSDLLLRKLAQLTGDYRKSEGKSPVGLNPQDLAVYLLKDSKRGSLSATVAITGYGSFEQMPTFDEVIRELYKKDLSLQSSLQMKE